MWFVLRSPRREDVNVSPTTRQAILGTLLYSSQTPYGWRLPQIALWSFHPSWSRLLLFWILRLCRNLTALSDLWTSLRMDRRRWNTCSSVISLFWKTVAEIQSECHEGCLEALYQSIRHVMVSTKQENSTSCTIFGRKSSRKYIEIYYSPQEVNEWILPFNTRVNSYGGVLGEGTSNE